jgi:hypothetical protein
MFSFPIVYSLCHIDLRYDSAWYRYYLPKKHHISIADLLYEAVRCKFCGFCFDCTKEKHVFCSAMFVLFMSAMSNPCFVASKPRSIWERAHRTVFIDRYLSINRYRYIFVEDIFILSVRGAWIVLCFQNFFPIPILLLGRIG